MPLAGLEPARGFPQQILNLLRLPFRHSDIAKQECIAWANPMVVVRGVGQPQTLTLIQTISGLSEFEGLSLELYRY